MPSKHLEPDHELLLFNNNMRFSSTLLSLGVHVLLVKSEQLQTRSESARASRGFEVNDTSGPLVELGYARYEGVRNASTNLNTFKG